MKELIAGILYANDDYIFYKSPYGEYWIQMRIHYGEREGRVMTNADCIRHMSDEQLYEFLSEWECGDIDYAVTFCDLCNEATKRGEVGNVLDLDCDGCRKHWLQRDAVDYGGLMYWKRNTVFDTADRKTEPNCSEKPNNSTTSKMEQVDKDINVRSKDEQQKDCNGCKFVGTYDTEFPCANCSRKTKDYYANDEPQTDKGVSYSDHTDYKEPKTYVTWTEPQTERSE